MCVYLGDCFAHRYETSPSDYIDYIKRFYVKKLILTDVTIRSVFQNPVTYYITLVTRLFTPTLIRTQQQPR